MLSMSYIQLPNYDFLATYGFHDGQNTNPNEVSIHVVITTHHHPHSGL